MLELERPEGGWRELVHMQFGRHMPGVGALHANIFVCGGSDDAWTAQGGAHELSSIWRQRH